MPIRSDFLVAPFLKRIVQTLALIALGFVLAVAPLLWTLHSARDAESLGKLLSPQMKKVVAAAYIDGQMVVPRMNEFAWWVPNIPAPFVGSIPAPGQHQNAFINQSLFRNREEPQRPKPTGYNRIFLTGGSAAFSVGAPFQETTIGALLENELRKESDNARSEVFVSANPAWASTHERILIENRLLDFEPNVVVSYSGLNDIHWGKLGENSLWFRTYAEQNLFNLASILHLMLHFERMPDPASPQDAPVDPELVADRLLRNVRLAAGALRTVQAIYIFALQPSWITYLNRRTENGGEWFTGNQRYFDSCYDRIAHALRSLRTEDNFVFVDLRSVFDEIPADDRVFIDAYHTVDKGNAIVARALARSVQDAVAMSKSRPAR